MNVTIPGVAYEECFDPMASGMAKDMGLPEPTRAKRGRGYTMIYKELTEDQVQEMGEHLRDFGSTLMSGISDLDSGERSRYHTCIKTGEALLKQVRHA